MTSDAGILLLARITQAQAEMEAMKVANEQRARNDHAPAYDEDSFYRIHQAIGDAIVKAINSPEFGAIA